MTVSSFGAGRAVLQQILLGWQSAVHYAAIGGHLPWGHSPLLAVGSAWISGKLMPFLFCLKANCNKMGTPDVIITYIDSWFYSIKKIKSCGFALVYANL